jgi:hypothetical protein
MTVVHDTPPGPCCITFRPTTRSSTDTSTPIRHQNAAGRTPYIPDRRVVRTLPTLRISANTNIHNKTGRTRSMDKSQPCNSGIQQSSGKQRICSEQLSCGELPQPPYFRLRQQIFPHVRVPRTDAFPDHQRTQPCTWRSPTIRSRIFPSSPL